MEDLDPDNGYTARVQGQETALTKLYEQSKGRLHLRSLLETAAKNMSPKEVRQLTLRAALIATDYHTTHDCD